MRSFVIFAMLFVAIGVALAGCGAEGGFDQADIDRARAEAVREERARQAARTRNERIRSLERQQREVEVSEEATDPRFGTCREAKSYGYGMYVLGRDPEYHWYRDADNDGIVCE